MNRQTDLGPTVAVVMVLVRDDTPPVMVDASLGAPATLARAVLAARSARTHADGIWCTPKLPDGQLVSARSNTRRGLPVILVVAPGREAWNVVELSEVIDLRRKVRA